MLPCLLPGRPLHRSGWDVCYHSGWKETQRAWNCIPPLCCTFNLNIKLPLCLFLPTGKMQNISNLFCMFSSNKNLGWISLGWPFLLSACEWVLLASKYNYDNNKTNNITAAKGCCVSEALIHCPRWVSFSTVMDIYMATVVGVFISFSAPEAQNKVVHTSRWFISIRERKRAPSQTKINTQGVSNWGNNGKQPQSWESFGGLDNHYPLIPRRNGRHPTRPHAKRRVRAKC